LLAEIDERAKRARQPRRSEISVTPPSARFDDLKRYRDLGVHRVIPIGFVGEADDIVRTVETTAEAMIVRG
jgi:hypothetical protein